MDPKELSAIEACQAGELGSFDDLYQRYAERIYRFVYFKTFHKETAEDITSDIFMKAMERINQFDKSKGTFSAWIYRVARNTIIDHYRTAHPTDDIEEGIPFMSSTNIEREVEADVALEKVKEAIRTLKTDQQEIVIMRLWDGLSHEEISQILGMTESNVKQIFSRTIRKLREDFGESLITILILIRMIS